MLPNPDPDEDTMNARAVVVFVDVVSGTPAIPSGATQDFRFRAVAVGQAIVGFHNTGSGKVVKDTVVVR